MRRWIRHIHLYLGILVSPYLIIYGLSSFEYNHREWFERELGQKSEATYAVDMEAARRLARTYHDPVIPPYIRNPQPTWTEDRALAQEVRDELGLAGWPIGWEMKRESETLLRFNLNRPGRKYTIELDEAAGQALVTSRGTGFWSVIPSLHALGGVPNSAFVTTWGIYTEITTWVVFFFIVTGIYLWIARSSDRRAGLICVITGLGISGAIILYAWMGA